MRSLWRKARDILFLNRLTLTFQRFSKDIKRWISPDLLCVLSQDYQLLHYYYYYLLLLLWDDIRVTLVCNLESKAIVSSEEICAKGGECWREFIKYHYCKELIYSLVLSQRKKVSSKIINLLILSVNCT